MKILLYTGKELDDGGDLRDEIHRSIAGVEVESVRSQGQLRRNLGLARASIVAVVMFIRYPEELESMMELQELLVDSRLVLVLGDTEDSLLAQAHRLRPRYIADMDASREDITAVLMKLVQNYTQGAIRNIP